MATISSYLKLCPNCFCFKLADSHKEQFGENLFSLRRYVNFKVLKLLLKPSTHYKGAEFDKEPFGEYRFLMTLILPVFFNYYKFHLGPIRDQDQDEYMWEVS